jgi:hypothetical protein
MYFECEPCLNFNEKNISFCAVSFSAQDAFFFFALVVHLQPCLNFNEKISHFVPLVFLLKMHFYFLLL